MKTSVHVQNGRAVRAPVTMAEIAAACGVSRATVSYVLNRVPKARGLQPETVARIERAAKDLGYRINNAARAIKTGRSRTLAFFTPPLRFESNILVMHGAALTAMEHGYHLKYVPVQPDRALADELVAACVDRMIGGAICLNLPRPLLLDLDRQARKSGLVLAQAGDSFDDIGGLSVVADHMTGTREVIDHLAELGHRRIALLMNDSIYSSSVMRLEGFRAALQANNISLPAYRCRSTQLVPDVVRKDTLALLNLKQRPTAIVCDTDPVALAVLHTVHGEGLRVPGDVSITGYVNLAFCEFTQPKLTSVEVQSEALGHQIASRLIARLENQPPVEMPPVLPRLVPRESSGPAPADA
jgi:LacI family transcriptional regulator